MTNPVTVLITAVGGIGVGEQILKALRLAPSGRYRIIATDTGAQVPQFAWADVAVRLPAASAPEYLEALEAICRHYGVRALFHGSEPEMKLFARAHERIRAWGVLPMINMPALLDLCLNKIALGRRLQELGFFPPLFHEIDNADDLARFDFFPTVVKPALDSGGSRGVPLARDRRELELLYALISKSSGKLVAQEYVGRPEGEFTVGILHDFDGKYISTCVLRRDLSSLLNVQARLHNTTGRDDLGPNLVISSGVSAGEFGAFPDVAAQCRQMAEALGSRGPLNFQCRMADGKARVFEINPRFSGTTSLRAMAGVNEPDLMIQRHVAGIEIPRGLSPRPVRIARSLLETIVPGSPAPSWKEAIQMSASRASAR
jgi:carbamoyl-phosphate synthase large subunit